MVRTTSSSGLTITDIESVGAEQPRIPGVFRLRMRASLTAAWSQGVGEHAGHQIDFVPVRNGEEIPRPLYARLLKHRRRRARSGHGLDVHSVLYFTQALRIEIDDHHFLAVLGQTLGNAESHFTRAHQHHPDAGGGATGSLKKRENNVPMSSLRLVQSCVEEPSGVSRPTRAGRQPGQKTLPHVRPLRRVRAGLQQTFARRTRGGTYMQQARSLQ